MVACWVCARISVSLPKGLPKAFFPAERAEVFRVKLNDNFCHDCNLNTHAYEDGSMMVPWRDNSAGRFGLGLGLGPEGLAKSLLGGVAGGERMAMPPWRDEMWPNTMSRRRT